MTRLAKSFLIPALSWIGLTLPTFAVAQSGKRTGQTSRTQRGIAVVELFTSQGCSSCPPADGALQQIAKAADVDNLPVYVLSFHVDYWNRLGWTDPYSDASFSQRQRAYAAAMKSDRVYTPQMIVNGTSEFVGSHRGKANQAISKSLRQNAKVGIVASVERSTSSQRIQLNYELSGQAVGKVLNVAVVETPKSNAVPRGENAGRDLSHVNVVRAFRSNPIEHWNGKAWLDLPDDLDPTNIRAIVYVQDPKTLSVLGATAIN